MAAPGRYAIYFVPSRETPLGDAGARWLGYDADSGLALGAPADAPVPAERWSAITATPGRYGFHATLKPPFALADGYGEDDLRAAAAALARDCAPVAIPRLAVHALAGFLALVPDPPEGPTGPVRALAAACVRRLDGLRAPPGMAELARRRQAGLTPRQEACLTRWGYPYVLNEFRFHMTLTDRLADDERAALAGALAARFAAALGGPVAIDALSLLHQPEPAAPFRLLERFALGGAAPSDPAWQSCGN